MEGRLFLNEMHRRPHSEKARSMGIGYLGGVIFSPLLLTLGPFTTLVLQTWITLELLRCGVEKHGRGKVGRKF